jgi:hypothetical protein
MLVLLLLGITRCASADLCPDDEALISAVTGRDEANIEQLLAQAYAENPDGILSAQPERIKGISDVICGNALPGDLPTVTCKFTVRYWSRNSYQVARLVKRDGQWQIDGALAVSRKR